MLEVYLSILLLGVYCNTGTGSHMEQEELLLWEKVALEEVLMIPYESGTIHHCDQLSLPDVLESNITKSGSRVVSILQMNPPSFLPNYHNPCWYECVDARHVYEQNLYIKSTSIPGVTRTVAKMKRVFEERALKGNRIRLRCLPYFYIAGAPYSGTSDLIQRISLHEDILKGPAEELNWWTTYRHQQSGNGIINQVHRFNDYLDLYDKDADYIRTHTKLTGDNHILYHQKITVDTSTSTFWNNLLWKYDEFDRSRGEPEHVIPYYIHHVQPNAKFVFMFKNPTDRLYESYIARAEHKASPEDFHYQVLQQIDTLEGCVNAVGYRQYRPCVMNEKISEATMIDLEVGMYGLFLSEWMSVFPRENLFILRTEDYINTIYDTANMIFEFLGVAELDYESIKMIESAHTAAQDDVTLRNVTPMYIKTRELLQNFYKPHNIKLTDLLDDERWMWYEEMVQEGNEEDEEERNEEDEEERGERRDG